MYLYTDSAECFIFFFFTILLPPPVLYNMGSHYRQCFLVLCTRYYIVEAFTAILTRDIAMVMANILSLRVNIYRSLVALYSWKELVQVNFCWCVCRLRRPKRFDLVLMLFQINWPDVYNGRSYGADWFIACFMHNLYYRLASFFLELNINRHWHELRSARNACFGMISTSDYWFLCIN